MQQHTKTTSNVDKIVKNLKNGMNHKFKMVVNHMNVKRDQHNFKRQQEVEKLLHTPPLTITDNA